MWRLLDQGVIQPQSVTLTKIANGPHPQNKQHAYMQPFTFFAEILDIDNGFG